MRPCSFCDNLMKLTSWGRPLCDRHMPLQQNHACKDDRQHYKRDMAVDRVTTASYYVISVTRLASVVTRSTAASYCVVSVTRLLSVVLKICNCTVVVSHTMPAHSELECRIVSTMCDDGYAVTGCNWMALRQSSSGVLLHIIAIMFRVEVFNSVLAWYSQRETSACSWRWELTSTTSCRRAMDHACRYEPSSDLCQCTLSTPSSQALYTVVRSIAMSCSQDPLPATSSACSPQYRRTTGHERIKARPHYTVGLMPAVQSAYRQGHLTKTALLKILSDIMVAADCQKVTLLGSAETRYR